VIDAEGADAAGLLGVWLNRSGDVVPDFTGLQIPSLDNLLA
jgi:putative hydrolase of the HAD superfamily